MQYKDSNFIKLVFPDGTTDIKEHPYICLLDKNSPAKKYHLLKGKTFIPTKHLKYVKKGTDIVTKLLRPTIINLVEPLDLEFVNESILQKRFIKTIDYSEFVRISNQYYDFNNCNSTSASPIFLRDKDILQHYLKKI